MANLRTLGAEIAKSPEARAHLVREVVNFQTNKSPPDPSMKDSRHGMRFARVLAPIFVTNDPKEVQFSKMALQAGVIGLMLQNMAWLYEYPQTPALYHAGVVYKPEKHRVDRGSHVVEYGEDWQTIPWVIYHGFGDCEDLGAWRAAELQMRGIRALPHVIIRQMPDGAWRAHVQVKHPNGKIEDPAAKLGMYSYSY